MRHFLKVVLAAILTLWAFGLAAQPVPVESPDEFVADVIETLVKKGARDTAVKIAQTIGRPAALEALQSALQILAGKEFEVTEKVIDKHYGSAMRQIVYYAYLRDGGFVYVRFNFKRTGAGLILANFAFKDETNELFPKDFVDR
jgi:hypothetical protein